MTIDDDVLAAAKGLAEQQRKTLGEVASILMRRSLQPAARRSRTRNGVHLLPRRSGATPVTLELVNQLRDEWPE